MAKDKVKPKDHGIKNKDIEKGVYLTDGAFGEGWYHINTPEDQVFRGHPGQKDFIVLDFKVQPTPGASIHFAGAGNDQITHWDKGLDGFQVVSPSGGSERIYFGGKDFDGIPYSARVYLRTLEVSDGTGLDRIEQDHFVFQLMAVPSWAQRSVGLGTVGTLTPWAITPWPADAIA